uniref:Uncharacterized protein n=1 Tax=Parascaris univalens TaxID=6257 RepID=A0A915C4W1_PARUN
SLLIKHIRLVIPISMWLHCSNRSYIKVMMLVNRSTLHLLSAPFIMSALDDHLVDVRTARSSLSFPTVVAPQRSSRQHWKARLPEIR